MELHNPDENGDTNLEINKKIFGELGSQIKVIKDARLVIEYLIDKFGDNLTQAQVLNFDRFIEVCNRYHLNIILPELSLLIGKLDLLSNNLNSEQKANFEKARRILDSIIAKNSASK
jgi:hypothetical protein